MVDKLSKGCLKQIEIPDTLTSKNVQIASFENTVNTMGQPKVRMVISDSEFTRTCLLGSLVQRLISDKKLNVFDIIQIKDYVVNKQHCAIILMEVDFIESRDALIGTPKNINVAKAEAKQKATEKTPEKLPEKIPENTLDKDGRPVLVPPPHLLVKTTIVPPTNPPTNLVVAKPVVKPVIDPKAVMLIAQLDTYYSLWTIKVRCTRKSDIKFWTSRETGAEGKLCNVVMMDKTGAEIKCVFFNKQVDAFEPLLQLNSCYLIRNGAIKPANAKFAGGVKCPVEITFDSNTIIEKVDEDAEIKGNETKLRKIADLDKVEKDGYVDVLGFVEFSSDVKTYMKGDKEFSRKTLTLSDTSDNKKYSVELTVWNKQIDKFDSIIQGHIILLKSVKKSDFAGTSLTFFYDSLVEVNPLIPAAGELYDWMVRNGQSAECIKMTKKEYSKK